MKEKTLVKADIKHNRMYLKFSGSYSIEETIPVINMINHEVVKLKPGFGVINDLRELKYVNLKAALRIKKGTTILQQQGARHLIRVVGGSKMAVKVFAKFSNIISKMKISYVPTIEKAEEILAEHNL